MRARRIRAALAPLAAFVVHHCASAALATETTELRTSGFVAGQARFPASNQDEERDDFLTEAVLQQAIELGTPVPEVTLRPYAELELSVDTKWLDHNNFGKASAGGEIEWRPVPWAAIAAGAAYEVEQRYVSGETLKGPAAYVRWYAAGQTDVPSAIARDTPLEIVAFTWGEVRFPAKQEEAQRDSVLLQGRGELGLEFPAFTPYVRPNAFVELGYKWDSNQLPFNNKIEPAIGGKLRVEVTDWAAIDLGIKYQREYRFASGTQEGGPIVFLNWYMQYD